MFTNWDWDSIIENFVKIAGSLVGGGFIWKFIEARRAKQKEAVEVANAYKTGTNLEIQIKTNIDKIVEDKTKVLNGEIIDLKNTIVQISTKYTTDLDRYIARMVDLEKKFDDQIDRNKDVEDRLFAEIKIREECIKELNAFRTRIKTVETKTQQIKQTTDEMKIVTQEIKTQVQTNEDKTTFNK